MKFIKIGLGLTVAMLMSAGALFAKWVPPKTVYTASTESFNAPSENLATATSDSGLGLSREDDADNDI